MNIIYKLYVFRFRIPLDRPQVETQGTVKGYLGGSLEKKKGRSLDEIILEFSPDNEDLEK